MLIEITYNVTDVYMSTTETPVYVEISFEQPGSASAVWGSITGTLSNQTDLQNALNLKVPYTGATGNVNIGEYELKAGQVTLDTSPTGTAAVGTIRWNDTTGTSETTLKGGNVIIKNGVDLVARVVNKVSPNTTLTKAAYQAVRVSGAQGQRLAIELAQANNDAGSADTIGLVTETIAPNQEGFIMTVGQLEGINTTGSLQGETWVDGDVLYLSPTTAGAITNVKPTGATGHLVIIGYVEYAHANNGKIYVKVINGFELAELHDTSIVTPTNNQGLFYNSSNSLWENKTISTALGYTPVPTTRNITINGVTYDLSADRTYTISTGITGSGASGQVTYWTGASAVSGSNNLFWDSANGRLGIGTNVPTESMQVVGGNLLVDNNRGYRIKNTSGSTLDVLKADTSNNLLLGSLFLGGAFYLYTNTSFRWFQYPSSVATERMQLSTSGNLLIGSTTDNGQRLQVYGDTLLRGSGNTNSTTALTVQNSDAANIFRFRNDGIVLVGNSANATQIRPVNSSGTLDLAGDAITFLGVNSINSASVGNFNFTGNTIIPTSGFHPLVNLLRQFAPTSGTAQAFYLNIVPTINQTGGASGTTVGIRIAPSLTAAADWRSIEWSNNSGYGLYGAGTANNYMAGRLGIGSTSLANTTVRVGNNITGATSHFSVFASQTVLSDVANASIFTTEISTQATAFTLNTLRHYRATKGTFGAGSIVANQYGFFAESTLTDATNNYGFWGDIASGTGRWNLYMNGTADNYLAGNLGIGITPTVRLHVSGDTILRGSGATSATTALTVQNSSSTNLFTVRNDGESTFGGNMSLTRTGNNTTTLTITNTTAGSLTQPRINLVADGGTAGMFKVSSAYGGYKINTVNDFSVFNGTSGNINILNDHASGSILMAAGGSSTAHFTIASTGKVLYAAATTAKAQINLASGTAPTSPVDGDIWFDGTDIKMRIGGVTKTFTLI